MMIIVVIMTMMQASQTSALTVKEQLDENEKLMEEYSLTWDEKLQKTGQMQEDRRMALEKMGISVESSGIKVDKEEYFLGEKRILRRQEKETWVK